MDEKLVLQWHVSGAVKHDFWLYIWHYASTNENFDYNYPHSNVLMINDVNFFWQYILDIL